MKLVIDSVDTFTLEAETVQDRAWMGQFITHHKPTEEEKLLGVTVRLTTEQGYHGFRHDVDDPNEVSSIRFNTLRKVAMPTFE